jgi:gliding motility-associated lipoprotein GldD
MNKLNDICEGFDFKKILFKPLFWSTFLLVCLTIIFTGCRSDYSPKSRAYFRIDFPEKNYQTFQDENCPFSFKYPVYASVYQDTEYDAEPCWKHVHFKPFDAYIHLSYKPVASFENFHELREDARSFVFEHTVKASEIHRTEKNINNHSLGVIYEMQGNTASAIQFYVTDTNQHYLRGALYFNAPANRDSLDPVINFIAEDIDILMRSLEWK